MLLQDMRKVQKRRDREAALRAGLVTAAIYNVNRKRGTRSLKPTDFIKSEPAILTPEQMEAEMDRWAKSTNRRIEA